MEKEKIVTVIDFDNYKASSLGYIISYAHGTKRVLKPGLGRGRQFVVLYKNGIKKSKQVNRIIWESFNGKTDLEIDHINENPIDNRLSNLQPLTPRENTAKYHKSRHHSSVYTGVSYRRSTNRWRAGICINGDKKDLGEYKNEIDAHNAYQNELLKSAKS